jgi:DNA-directed RNA polymerase subunit F
MTRNIRNIEEEVTWSIKQMEKHVWCFNTATAEYARELHDNISSILWTWNIEPLFTYIDDENHRYVILVDIDPDWAFITKVIPDKWDHHAYLAEIAEIYRTENK